jgi:dTDP-glucose 4,6-dehydratase
MRVLVTGGAGFIGSTFVKLLRARHPNGLVVNLDALTYAGNLETLATLEGDARHVFVKGDIGDLDLTSRVMREHAIEAVVNFAAESHVDRSVLSGAAFVDTNITGTFRLLEAARASGVRRFMQISTDEVYGSLGPAGKFTESSPINPRSPYSASKAAADHMVMAFHHTYGLDVVITRCSNNYGPFQFPEKLIPLMILNAFDGKPLPVYGDGLYVRDWIHVEDHCDALDLVLRQGRAGEVYNVGGDSERANIDVVRGILTLTGRDDSLIRHVADRPGHDRRYAIDASKLRDELGWAPRRTFEAALAETVAWYRDNRRWWSRVLSAEYRAYWEQQYGQRLSR